jgi:hypothetical protein
MTIVSLHGTLPPPDLDAAVEPIKAVRVYLTLARDLAARVSRESEYGDVAAEMTETWDGCNNLLHDNVEPAIALMERRADEAAGEAEAASMAIESVVHQHATVQFGRG